MKTLIKKVKQISLLILMISFIGCEEDDVASSLPQVTAGFTFTINADTGTVTFINISESATTYLWSFGDDTTSTEVNPIKTYVDGTYTVTLTAKNVSGASNTFESEVVVSIPEEIMLPIGFDNAKVNYTATPFNGVAFEIVTNPDLSGTNTTESNVGKITNSGAQFEGFSFDLGVDADFSTKKTITMNFWSESAVDLLLKFEEGNAGDIETTASHTGSGWETLSFDFSSSDKYSRITLFVDGPGTTAGTFYVDDITQIETPTPPSVFELPINFDDDGLTYTFDVFNGASYQIIDNPQLSGTNNTASKVGEITNVGAMFEGGTFTLETPVDFSTKKRITMNVYSTVSIPVLLKFEGAGDPIEQPEIHGGTGWETMTFDFTSSDTFNKLVLFMDGPGTTAGIFYIDDIIQTETTVTPVAKLELPINFDDSSLTYTFDVFNGASYQIVDNPQLSGTNNTASKVGEITNVGAMFEGGAFTLETPVDFSTNKRITMDIYSTVSIPVLLKFERTGDPIEKPETHGGTGWETMTFDFTSSDTFNKLVLFMDGPGTTAGTFYIDNITQTSTSGGGNSGTGCSGTATGATAFPVNFESCESFISTFTNDGSITTELAANPSKVAPNTSDNVLKVVKASGTNRWAGFQNVFSSNLDLTKTLKVKVYSSKAGAIMKFEVNGSPQDPSSGNPGPQYRTINDANTWTEVEVVFTGVPGNNTGVNQLVIKPDNPDGTDGETTSSEETYYFDDLTLE